MSHFLWNTDDTAVVERQFLAVGQVFNARLFSSGPVGSEPVDAKGRDQLAAAAPKEFSEFARTIQPREQRVFFGAYDPDAAPAGLAEGLMARFMRIAPAVRNALPAGDFRDWPAIEAWACGIASELITARTTTAAHA